MEERPRLHAARWHHAAAAAAAARRSLQRRGQRRTAVTPCTGGCGPMHAGCSPMHAGCSPMHAGCSPVHAGCSPMHAGCSPMHAGCSPMHAGCSPMHAGQRCATATHLNARGQPRPQPHGGDARGALRLLLEPLQRLAGDIPRHGPLRRPLCLAPPTTRRRHSTPRLYPMPTGPHASGPVGDLSCVALWADATCARVSAAGRGDCRGTNLQAADL